MAGLLEKWGLIPKRVNSDIVESVAAKYNQLPELDQFEAQSIGQILDYKNRYESAQKAYNRANQTLSDANSTQAARSQAQSDMAAAQQIMDEAHKGADFTRRVANNRGIDLSNYDAYNTSLDDANVNFTAKAQQDISDLFAKDLTPDQYYRRLVRELRANGATKGQAERIAAEQTQDYSIDREARFNTAMQMYGQNGNGALTDLGIQMMDKFGRDHPDTLNLYGTMYATPSKQYDNAVQAAREQAARNDARAATRETLALQHMYGLQDKGWSAYLNKILGDSAAARDWIYGRADKQEEIAQKAAAAQQEAYMKSPQFTWNQAKALGMSDKMARDAVLSKHYPELFKANADALKANKNDEKAQKSLLGLFGSMYGAIEGNLELGTDEGNAEAKRYIDDLKKSVTGEDVKDYYEWLDANRVKEVLKTANLYEQVVNGQMTWKDAKIKMYRDTFDLDDIHTALKTGQKQAAQKLIDENLQVIATGEGLVDRTHFDYNETSKIKNELDILKMVADGQITYDEALIQLGLKQPPKEQTQSATANQGYGLGANVPNMGASINNGAAYGSPIIINGNQQVYNPFLR